MQYFPVSKDLADPLPVEEQPSSESLVTERSCVSGTNVLVHTTHSIPAVALQWCMYYQVTNPTQ